MGRGRQKAKHTKLARELKSFSPSLDVAALQRELGKDEGEDLYVDRWSDDAGEDDTEEYKSA